MREDGAASGAAGEKAEDGGRKEKEDHRMWAGTATEDDKAKTVAGAAKAGEKGNKLAVLVELARKTSRKRRKSNTRPFPAASLPQRLSTPAGRLDSLIFPRFVQLHILSIANHS